MVGYFYPSLSIRFEFRRQFFYLYFYFPSLCETMRNERGSRKRIIFADLLGWKLSDGTSTRITITFSSFFSCTIRLCRIDNFLLRRCKEIRKFFGFYLVYNSPDLIGYF